MHKMAPRINQKGNPRVWHRVRGLMLALGLLGLCLGYALMVCVVLCSPLLLLLIHRG